MLLANRRTGFTHINTKVQQPTVVVPREMVAKGSAAKSGVGSVSRQKSKTEDAVSSASVPAALAADGDDVLETSATAAAAAAEAATTPEVAEDLELSAAPSLGHDSEGVHDEGSQKDETYAPDAADALGDVASTENSLPDVTGPSEFQQLLTSIDETDQVLALYRPESEQLHVSTTLDLKCKPTCRKCGNEVDPFKAQLKSKSGGAFVCNACNSKGAMLSRRFPGWSNSDFALLTESQQQQFWKEAAGCNNFQQLERQFVNSIVSKRVDLVRSKLTGKYLPLSVYQAQGFNAEDIVAKCTDTKEHPVLGLCYRVPICEIGREATEELHREQVLKSLGESKQRKRKASEAVATEAVKEEGDDSNDDSNIANSQSSDKSTSSNTSSSSEKKTKKKKGKKQKHDKKNKKNKKDKKDKSKIKKDDKRNKNKESKHNDASAKEKLKQEAEQQKQRAKDAKAREVICCKLLSKLDHPLYQVRTTLKNTLIQQVAAFAVDALKNDADKLIALETTLRKMQKKGDFSESLPCSHQDLGLLVKQALANRSIVETMLDAARAHFKK